MSKPIVYLSASHKAPLGMKEHVRKMLEDYECEVFVWDDHDDNEDSIKHLEEKVEIILMIPPAETYYADKCTIGRGQKAELDAFICYAWDEEEGEMKHPNYHTLLVNLDETRMQQQGLYVDEIDLDYLKETMSSQYDSTCNAASFIHNGAAMNIANYVTRLYNPPAKKKVVKKITKMVMTDFEESEMAMKESSEKSKQLLMNSYPFPTEDAFDVEEVSVLIAYNLIK